MKLITSNPVPFLARSEVERVLCEMVKLNSGEPVIELRTREECSNFDCDGERVEIEGDYELRTGTLIDGLICSGSVFLGFVASDGTITIEWDGSWNA